MVIDVVSDLLRVRKKKDVVSVCYLGHKVLVKHLANILESILYQKEIIKNEIKAHENLS